MGFYHIQPKLVKKLLSSSSNEPNIRIGHGFDLHRLIEGTKLIIGGVDIPYKVGADAHSDGDALYHWLVSYYEHY